MQNIFKQLHGEKGVLYSWYEAMHTRIDLIICNKTKEESILITQLIEKEIQRIEIDSMKQASYSSSIKPHI